MVKITFVGHATFMLEHEGKRIYTDPYELTSESKGFPADGILISHDHHDHFDKSAINIIKKPKTEMLCPLTCKEPIEEYHAKGLKPYEKSSICGFIVDSIPAYNPNKKFHPKKNQWLGYIVTMGDTRIFHAGDTDYIPEYEELKGKVDIALLPLGDTYTMDFQDGLKTVKAIEPKFIIPMHLWDKDPILFKQECEKQNPKTNVVVMGKMPIEF